LPRNVCQGIFVFWNLGKELVSRKFLAPDFPNSLCSGNLSGDLIFGTGRGTMLIRFVLRILCSPDICCEDYVPRFLGTGGSMFYESFTFLIPPFFFFFFFFF
jgi:hypothetical protein